MTILTIVVAGRVPIVVGLCGYSVHVRSKSPYRLLKNVQAFEKCQDTNLYLEEKQLRVWGNALLRALGRSLERSPRLMRRRT
jgi:hypothetical protein